MESARPSPKLHRRSPATGLLLVGLVLALVGQLSFVPCQRPSLRKPTRDGRSVRRRFFPVGEINTLEEDDVNEAALPAKKKAKKKGAKAGLPAKRKANKKRAMVDLDEPDEKADVAEAALPAKKKATKKRAMVDLDALEEKGDVAEVAKQEEPAPAKKKKKKKKKAKKAKQEDAAPTMVDLDAMPEDVGSKPPASKVSRVVPKGPKLAPFAVPIMLVRSGQRLRDISAEVTRSLSAVTPVLEVALEEEGLSNLLLLMAIVDRPVFARIVPRIAQYSEGMRVQLVYSSIPIDAGREPTQQEEIFVSLDTNSYTVQTSLMSQLEANSLEVVKIRCVGREASHNTLQAIENVAAITGWDLRIQVEKQPADDWDPLEGVTLTVVVADEASQKLYPTTSMWDTAYMESTVETIAAELACLTVPMFELEAPSENTGAVLELVQTLPEALSPYLRLAPSLADHFPRYYIGKGFDIEQWSSGAQRSKVSINAGDDTTVLGYTYADEYLLDGGLLEIHLASPDLADEGMQVLRSMVSKSFRDLTIVPKGKDTILVAIT